MININHNTISYEIRNNMIEYSILNIFEHLAAVVWNLVPTSGNPKIDYPRKCTCAKKMPEDVKIAHKVEC